MRDEGLIMQAQFDNTVLCWCMQRAPTEPVEICDGSYLDDTLYMLEADEPALVESKLKRCMEIFVELHC